MSCYHPNYILFRTYECNPPGKFDTFRNELRNVTLKATKDNPNKFFGFINNSDIPKGDILSANKFLDRSYFYKDELVSVPCGKCIGCSLDYSKQWATRCYFESLQFKENFFITLTYDDKHLPRSSLGNATLVKDDLSKFIKDVRNFWMNNYNHVGIRYFAAGEYGSTSFRPHYHLLMFNLPIFDLIDTIPFIDNENGKVKIENKVSNGNIYYWSEVLSKIWNKGQVVIGKVNYQTCAYTARYVVKKARGKEKDFMEQRLGLVPEFVKMSTKPGLGADFCLKNLSHIIEYDSIQVPTSDNVIINSIPRYFMKLIEKEDLISFEQLSDVHKQAISDNIYNIYKMTNLSYRDYLESMENVKLEKVKSLIRNLT